MINVNKVNVIANCFEITLLLYKYNNTECQVYMACQVYIKIFQTVYMQSYEYVVGVSLKSLHVVG